MSVIIETSIGQFVVDLYCDERPKCCMNFLKLCKIKYYNYCLFHSVQERLVAQTGDPSGTGNGGYSIWQQLTGEKYFQNELKPKIKHNKSGLLSMVNNGGNMHGSQFCITLSDNLDYLDGKHTVFGEIVEGIDIVKKLNEVFVDKQNIPLKDVMIYHTIIIDDPFDDPKGLMVPEMSPEPRDHQLNSGRVGAEEDITINGGATEEELAELEHIKEARSNAQILTVIGDIPEEDIKPPENVLFVCSLNPVTCSEDLELIFSRFGEILSCEVIKDHKTGSSLQYAFIEFAEKDACEKAFFEMERVLIDDRRIHVDFSQSVSKQWQMYNADKFGQRNIKRRCEGYEVNKSIELSQYDTHISSRIRHRSRSNERREHQSNRYKDSDKPLHRSRSRDRQHHTNKKDEYKYKEKSHQRDRSGDRNKRYKFDSLSRRDKPRSTCDSNDKYRSHHSKERSVDKKKKHSKESNRRR